MTLKIRKLNPNATIPKRETKGAAGLDLHACLNSPVTIGVGEIFTVPTGIALSPEREDIVMFVIIRSSLGRKHGLTLANSVGVIDSDYRGEILVPIINHGDKPYTLSPDERFAQLVITPVIFPEVCEALDLDSTERGDAGFGSTGKL